MPEQEWSPRELIELWLAVAEHDASADEIERLSQLVVDDPQARQCLAALAQQQSFLLWNGATMAEARRDPGMRELAAEIADTHALNCFSQEAALLSEDAAQPRGDGSPSRRALTARTLPWMRSAAWAASVAAALLVGVFIASRQRQPNVAALEQPVQAAEQAARLTLATACHWGTDEPVWAVGGSVRTGDEINLLEGLAEVRLDGGATFAIEGPASIFVASPNALVLHYGKLTGHAPWSPKNLTIATPAGRAEIRNADFGLRVAGENVDVHVFQGEARFHVAAAPDDDQARPGAASESIVAVAGEALSLVAQRGEAQERERGRADAAQFATRSSMAGTLPITPEYVDAVRASRPIGYWRFETIDDAGRIPNEVSDRYALFPVGGVQWSGDAHNRAAEFAPRDQISFLAAEEPFAELPTNDYTVELWMKPSHVHNGALVSLVVDPGAMPEHHTFLLELQHGYQSSKWNSRVRYLHRRQPMNMQGGSSCLASEPYQVRRWQHVAAVKQGDEMRLYVDGALIGADTNLGPLADSSPTLLVGELYSNRQSRPYVGQLDELAIYDHALSADELIERCTLVKQQPQGASRDVN